MVDYLNLSDIVEPNGKTIRQNNLETPHRIPLKTLVEINCDYHAQHGVRAFVGRHDRDCDGTPLYGLILDPNILDKITELETKIRGMNYSADMVELNQIISHYKSKIEGTWSEDSLIVIDNKERSREQRVETVLKTLDQFPVLIGRLTKTHAEHVVNALNI